MGEKDEKRAVQKVQDAQDIQLGMLTEHVEALEGRIEHLEHEPYGMWIRKADNGYIVLDSEGEEYVFSDEERDEELTPGCGVDVAALNVLRFLANTYFVTDLGSKHTAKRVRIVVENNTNT